MKLIKGSISMLLKYLLVSEECRHRHHCCSMHYILAFASLFPQSLHHFTIFDFQFLILTAAFWCFLLNLLLLRFLITLWLVAHIVDAGNLEPFALCLYLFQLLLVKYPLVLIHSSLDNALSCFLIDPHFILLLLMALLWIYHSIQFLIMFLHQLNLVHHFMVFDYGFRRLHSQ